MAKILYSKKAQNFLEYALLIVVVSTAIIAMQQYIQRSINAKLRQIQEELSESRR
jgi:Flp pilus assembly pilin Flp